MIRATDIHSLSDFQRNAKSYVHQIISTKNPIALTVNGEAEVVVQDAASYEQMLDRLEKAELLGSLRRALDEIEQDQGTALEEFTGELNQRYGA